MSWTLNSIMPFLHTDNHWEAMAREDPYFAVVTDEAYRGRNLSEQNLAGFFQTGEEYVAHTFNEIHRLLGNDWQPRRALDFGCGVGRVLFPLAERCSEVTGVDASPTMLDRAREHMAKRKQDGVDLVLGDDNLTGLVGTYDLIHSVLVFQHIPVLRGMKLMSALLDRLDARGVGVLHITTGNMYSSLDRLKVWMRDHVPLYYNLVNVVKGRPFNQPYMQMNLYDVEEVGALLKHKGCRLLYQEPTDHAGFRGAVLYLRKSDYCTKLAQLPGNPSQMCLKLS